MEGTPPPPDVEMDPADSGSRPTYEELQEENRKLRATVVGLMGSQAGLIRKKRALKKVKKIFKADWYARIERYRRQLVELPQLLEEEEELQVTVKELMGTMGQLSQTVREKEEEARKLEKKVARLEGRSQSQAVTIKKGVDSSRLTAVVIFPEEIWKMILVNLSDPKDLWNLCNTCQLFEDLLRPWKTGWMLEQALPHLYKHLPGRKLLECRQVSKGWNAAMNSFLDNHPATLPHIDNSDRRILDFVYPIKEKEIGNRNVFNFGPGEDLTRLEELFPKELGRNPFIGRYVNRFLRNPADLGEMSLEVEEARWAKLYRFLESYGGHIWNMVICFPTYCSPPIQQKIKQLLTVDLFQLAPNLKRLSITETGTALLTSPNFPLPPVWSH